MLLHFKIAKNTIIHLAGKFITLAVGLGSIMLLTRYLGQDGFGVYSTAVAYLMFWGALIDLGLTLTLVQMISDKTFGYERTVNAVMTLRLILTLLLFGIACFILLFFTYPAEVRYGSLILVWAYVGITLAQTLTVVFQ